MIDMLLKHRFNIDTQVKTNIAPIQYYANIDTNKQITGNTVLMFCIMQHNVAMVEYLLSRGANINIKNATSKNALTLAKDMRNAAIKQSEQVELGTELIEAKAIILKTEKIIALIMDAPNKPCNDAIDWPETWLNNAPTINFSNDQ